MKMDVQISAPLDQDLAEMRRVFDLQHALTRGGPAPTLGERRARAVTDYLVSLGVPGGRLKPVSYGKEAPVCQEHLETCWAKNRRGHFVITSN